MAELCEVCGRLDNDTMETSELMAETLHVCEQCRQDRQFGEDESLT